MASRAVWYAQHLKLTLPNLPSSPSFATFTSKVIPSSVRTSTMQQPGYSKEALLYCTLLALQFGLQPMIASRYTGAGVSKISVVIGTEIGKIIIAATSITAEGHGTWNRVFGEWSLMNSLKVAAIPATLYAIQNLCVQYGYVYLDSMTFNLLNQTKTLSAAFWLWIIMGQKQSYVQVFALGLLLLAAVLLNMGGAASTAGASLEAANYQLGVVLVMAASMISGLSAALTQRALVGSKPRHPLFFSAELAIYGIAFLLASGMFSNDRDLILSGNLFSKWSSETFVPVTTNAFGGVVVGFVTKYAGGVVKGFALIAGIVITGIAQWVIEGKPLELKDWIAVLLVSVSIYLHASYPIPKTAISADAKKQ